MDIDIGHDYLILSFSLTTSFANITTTRPFVSAVMKSKDGGNVVIRKSSTLTTEFNLNGDTLKIAAKKIPDAGTTTTICQAKVDAGTDTLEVILTLA